MSDLETELRATLTQAEATAPAPDDLSERLLLATTNPAGVPARNRRWLPPLLAAATVVAAVVGVTLGVRDSASRPSVSPTPTLRTTPAPPTPSARALTPLRCLTHLPPAWQHADSTGTALAAPSLLYGDEPLVGGDGLAAVQYTSSGSYRLVLLQPGIPARTLYRTPAGQPSPEQAMAIRSLRASGHWLAFTVADAGRPARIVLVNAANSTERVVRTLPRSGDLLSGRTEVIADGTADSGLALAGGGLYWTEVSSGRSAGRLYRYDIAAGTRQVLDDAARSGPLATAGDAVYWDSGRNTGGSRAQPAAWPHDAFRPSDVDWSARQPLLSAPGHRYVWQSVTGAIVAQRVGFGPPVAIIASGRDWQLENVIGHFVVARSTNGGTVVLDLRTGAAARWSAGAQRLAYATLSALVFTTKGGFAVIDAATLPDLTC